MANNYDISGGRGNSEDLDVRFSSSTPSGDLYSEKPADASAQSDIRRKRAEDMAKRIAMSIGEDDYESTQPVNVNERQRASASANDVTRESTMAKPNITLNQEKILHLTILEVRQLFLF